MALTLLELPMETLFWDGCGIYFCCQLNFFNLNKTVTYQHNLGYKICCCFLLDLFD
jgi:hypothetical protein